jgi:hypothetical protein
LYREAVAQLANCPRQLVPILSGTKIIGHQEMTMASENAALAIAALDELDEVTESIS